MADLDLNDRATLLLFADFLSPQAGTQSGKNNYYDRSHDMHENKGEFQADDDCSHDVYENK
jgi:hypothetical protein